jgi:hypothetical protein
MGFCYADGISPIGESPNILDMAAKSSKKKTRADTNENFDGAQWGGVIPADWQHGFTASLHKVDHCDTVIPRQTESPRPGSPRPSVYSPEVSARASPYQHLYPYTVHQPRWEQGPDGKSCL